jgi:hypothetical protein
MKPVIYCPVYGFHSATHSLILQCDFSISYGPATAGPPGGPVISAPAPSHRDHARDRSGELEDSARRCQAAVSELVPAGDFLQPTTTTAVAAAPVKALRAMPGTQKAGGRACARPHDLSRSECREGTTYRYRPLICDHVPNDTRRAVFSPEYCSRWCSKSPWRLRRPSW